MATEVAQYVIEPKKKSKVASHLEPWQQLEEKVVFVTGTSSGLGREFCLDLARVGCKIMAAARRADRLKSLCHEINTMCSSTSQFIREVAIELDVTADGPNIEASVKKAWDAFGHIDVVINNAGVRGGRYSWGCYVGVDVPVCVMCLLYKC
nr:3-oxoacyl-[acyl-carrier-protein] reductase 3, chloroplastic-like [Nicotiana tomentosiformis]